MGKNDFLTPKAIGNRIKAKGLQKLRWYCQMCQKQCRDENGFKCHLTSESHKRQMAVFGLSGERVVEGYSEEFEASFLEHLRVSHPSARVSAKIVYNEFINDRNHIHMNATKWLTLTEFVTYLGREGKCKVDETPKGWFISLIQRDPMADLVGEKRLKRDQAEKEEEERLQADIQSQIERARKVARVDQSSPSGGSELQRDADGQPVTIALQASRAGAAAAAKLAAGPSRLNPAFAKEDKLEKQNNQAGPSSGKPKSKVEELMEREKLLSKQRAERSAREAKQAADAQPSTSGREVPWLQEGIVVKVMSKELQQHGYYKKKGVVDRIKQKYLGVVRMLDSGDVLQVDQAQLETVLPQAGGSIMVLAGKYRGLKAQMLGINEDKFQAQVQIKGGEHAGEEVWLDYEHLSKLHLEAKS
ncbi:hypothetical protein WJX72_003398 [[Myrmecia] bisecta]|uniref:C2H2-type domain-containing protein n=1 Tax=[Myrmecia] bisecta TaxID=41462 RepID=A0AAW1Q172_9CHLO